MAVKTTFTDTALSNIFKTYDLGKYQNAVPFAKGTVQTNLLIRTSNGPCVFRYYESRTKASVLFETELLVFLKRHRFPCPGPYRNKEGTVIGMFGGKPYAVYEYMPGHHIEHMRSVQRQDLIRHVAELHTITRDYESLHIPERWNYNPAFCREQAQQRTQDLNSKQAREKSDWMNRELDALELPDTLPTGICHCDFDYTNILFDGDRLTALLDFDDANYTYLLFDLIHLIEGYAWPYGKPFDKHKAREVLVQYTVYRPLDETEKRHLVDVFKLSILIDCLWFFTRGGMPDFYEKAKIEYLDDMGRDGFCELLFG